MVVIVSKALTWGYAKLAKPLLFRMSADSVHENMIRSGAILQRCRLLMKTTAALLRYDNPILKQTIGDITLQNPLGLSAGIDKDARIVRLMAAVGFGFSEVGSLTQHSYRGNPQPWYTRLPKSRSIVVNSGLRSQGARTVIARMQHLYPVAFRQRFPINLSIARTNSAETCTLTAGITDYVETLKACEQADCADMYTINISCPNTNGGEPFTDPVSLDKLLVALESVGTRKPVFVKLPIDKSWSEADALLRVCSQYSFVSGITIGNLQKNRARADLREPLPDTVLGNLSGEPCFEDSNNLLASAYIHYGNRFIFSGVGGIFTADDAYTKIKLGAQIVQSATGLIFGGPAFPGRLNYELAQRLRADGYASISQAVGVDAINYRKEHMYEAN